MPDVARGALFHWLAPLRSPPPAQPDARDDNPSWQRSQAPDSDTELAVTWATHAAATWPWLVWGNVLGLGLLAMVRGLVLHSHVLALRVTCSIGVVAMRPSHELRPVSATQSSTMSS